MAVSAGTATLPVVPVLAKTFSRDLVNQAVGPAIRGSEKVGKEHGRRFGTSFSGGLRTGIGPVRGILRGMGPQLAAAFGGAAIVGAIKSVTDEARESAKVGRQTAAVLKATGGVANVTAKDVERLSGSLMRQVAVDDEIIASGANMLLTFKGVRNEVGKGNNVFDQATAAAVDMTAAMNGGTVTQQGLQRSTIQLGKALNDPIKGITALSRVGVTFTQGQKDQIAAMVKAGDTMGAQKIILAELKSEFGGAARAAVDPWQRVRVVMGEVKEQIGTALLPVLDKVAAWLAVKIPQAVDVLAEALRAGKVWWDRNKDSVYALANVLSMFYTPAVDSAAGKTKTMTSTAEQLLGMLKALMTVVLRAVQVWLFFEKGVIQIYGALASVIIAAGHTVNVLDRLSGGTGHAGDAMVAFGRDLKNQARRELKAVADQSAATQRAIDRLHGKDIDISATTSLHFTKTFTATDWSHARQAAGRMATGGLVRGPGGPTADQVPAWLSAGEAVVPARLVPAVAPFLAANGVPGFSLGGKIDQTGTAHSGVGKMMDKWGTVRLAALVKSLVSGGGSAAIKAFIESTDPLPYIWGAAGPGAYDCSGLVGAVYGKMRGHPGAGHGTRFFTTATIGPQAGLKGGLGAGATLQIGVTPGKGHMAGRYGGLQFEARGSASGIKVGFAARSPESFARRFHMARGGLVDPALVNLLARGGADIGGDQGKLRINGKVLDAGGWLQPGMTMAVNNTGKAERVTPPGGEVINYRKLAVAIAAAQRDAPPVVYLDRQKVSRAIDDARLWEARR